VVITALIGSIAGLMLSTPGMLRMALYFTPVVAAWILYGAVAGLSRASLAGKSRQSTAILQMLGAWIGLAGPALIGVGVALSILYHQSSMITEDMLAWSRPLIIAGLAAMLIELWIGIKALRIAWTLNKAGD